MSTALAAGGHAAGRWAAAAAAAGLAGLGRPRAEPTQQPPLARGEWPCLRERAPGGGLHVASRRALYTRRAAVPVSAWSRLGWEQVAAVSWPRPGAALHVSAWPHTDAAGLDLHVEPRSSLPAFARERVAACRLLERRVRLGSGRDATVVALRAPDTEQVSWLVHLDTPSGPADAACDDVTAMLRSLRAEYGF